MYWGADRYRQRVRWISGDVNRSDRKSTRLNSSHGYISYAVFCLKKKKSVRSYSEPLSETTKAAIAVLPESEMGNTLPAKSALPAQSNYSMSVLLPRLK